MTRRARPAVLLALTTLLLAASCVSTANQRTQTLSAALVTVDAARQAFLAYDAHEQADIVAKATSLEDGKAKLATYRTKRVGAEKAFLVAYNAIAVASTLNDDHSLDGVETALAQVVSAVVALTGGGK